MARFQAQTNAVLGEKLEELRRCLGLRSNQKAYGVRIRLDEGEIAQQG